MKTSFERYALTPDAMQAKVEDLLNTVKLTELSPDVFQGASFDYVGPRIFGGQVLAQALLAAAKTRTKHDDLPASVREVLHALALPEYADLAARRGIEVAPA